MPVYGYNLSALLYHRWYPRAARATRTFTWLLSAIVYSTVKWYYLLHVSIWRIFLPRFRTVSATLS
jgi:hypothetical protein